MMAEGTGGSLVIDVSRRVAKRNGVAVRLDATEWRLLEVLAAAGGRSVTPEELLGAAWGPGYVKDEAYLAVAVWRLRGKLEDDPTDPKVIQSAPDGGYLLWEPSLVA